MSKKVWCSICQSEGEWVEVQARDESFFVCPACGSEIWPQDEMYVKKLKKIQQIEEETRQNYVSLSLPEGLKIFGGERKTGKLPSKMKKPTLSTINKKMYDET